MSNGIVVSTPDVTALSVKLLKLTTAASMRRSGPVTVGVATSGGDIGGKGALPDAGAGAGATATATAGANDDAGDEETKNVSIGWRRESDPSAPMMVTPGPAVVGSTVMTTPGNEAVVNATVRLADMATGAPAPTAMPPGLVWGSITVVSVAAEGVMVRVLGHTNVEVDVTPPTNGGGGDGGDGGGGASAGAGAGEGAGDGMSYTSYMSFDAEGAAITCGAHTNREHTQHRYCHHVLVAPAAPRAATPPVQCRPRWTR